MGHINMEVSGTWDGLVSSILTTPVFPYLWLPHVIVMTFFLRSSLGPSAVPWAQRHPLSCYTLGLIYCFSGGLVGLFIGNKSLLTILTWSPNLYSFSIVWYLMFFSPYDLVHRLVSSLTPLLPLMVAAQDCIAVVGSGIRTTLEEHPTAVVYPVVFAVITSNGFLIFKYFEQMVKNTLPSHRAFVVPHHSTKTTVLASVLLVAQAHGHLPVNGEQLYVGLVLAAILLRLLTTYLIKDWDPYKGVENLICGPLYGRTMEEKGKKEN